MRLLFVTSALSIDRHRSHGSLRRVTLPILPEPKTAPRPVRLEELALLVLQDRGLSSKVIEPACEYRASPGGFNRWGCITKWTPGFQD